MTQIAWLERHSWHHAVSSNWVRSFAGRFNATTTEYTYVPDCNAKDLSMQCDDSELFCVPSLSETGARSDVSDLVTVRSAEQCAEEAVNASSRLRTQSQADLQPEVQSADDTELSADLATGNSSDMGVVSPQNTSYSSFCSSPQVDAFVSCLSLLEACVKGVKFTTIQLIRHWQLNPTWPAGV